MTAPSIAIDSKEKALRSLNQLPPFSATLNRLMATLARDDVSLAKTADLIEKDAVLAGNVLALVNSAIYGRRGRVNSVRHAVSLLGTAKLKNAALSMSITRLWNRVKTPSCWSMGQFNQHAIAVAILADLLAQEAPVEYPEGAFVAGLLHDLGALLMAVGLPDEQAEIDRQCDADPGSRTAVELAVLGITHGDLSAEALAIWNLPLPIQAAVRFHHRIELEPSRTDSQLPLSWVIRAADSYVVGMGVPLQQTTVQEEVEAGIFQQLGIEAEIPRLLEVFHGEFEGVKGFF